MMILFGSTHMKSVSILLLTTLLTALMTEHTSAAADAVIEEKAVPLEPLYPDSWYNGEGEEDERDLRFDANLRAARVSETEGGLAPKMEPRNGRCGFEGSSDGIEGSSDGTSTSR